MDSPTYYDDGVEIEASTPPLYDNRYGSYWSTLILNTLTASKTLEKEKSQIPFLKVQSQPCTRPGPIAQLANNVKMTTPALTNDATTTHNSCDTNYANVVDLPEEYCACIISKEEQCVPNVPSFCENKIISTQAYKYAFNAIYQCRQTLNYQESEKNPDYLRNEDNQKKQAEFTAKKLGALLKSETFTFLLNFNGIAKNHGKEKKYDNLGVAEKDIGRDPFGFNLLNFSCDLEQTFQELQQSEQSTCQSKLLTNADAWKNLMAISSYKPSVSSNNPEDKALLEEKKRKFVNEITSVFAMIIRKDNVEKLRPFVKLSGPNKVEIKIPNSTQFMENNISGEQTLQFKAVFESCVTSRGRKVIFNEIKYAELRNALPSADAKKRLGIEKRRLSNFLNQEFPTAVEEFNDDIYKQFNKLNDAEIEFKRIHQHSRFSVPFHLILASSNQQSQDLINYFMNTLSGQNLLWDDADEALMESERERLKDIPPEKREKEKDEFDQLFLKKQKLVESFLLQEKNANMVEAIYKKSQTLFHDKCEDLRAKIVNVCTPGEQFCFGRDVKKDFWDSARDTNPFFQKCLKNNVIGQTKLGNYFPLLNSPLGLELFQDASRRLYCSLSDDNPNFFAKLKNENEAKANNLVNFDFDKGQLGNITSLINHAKDCNNLPNFMDLKMEQDEANYHRNDENSLRLGSNNNYFRDTPAYQIAKEYELTGNLPIGIINATKSGSFHNSNTDTWRTPATIIANSGQQNVLDERDYRKLQDDESGPRLPKIKSLNFDPKDKGEKNTQGSGNTRTGNSNPSTSAPQVITNPGDSAAQVAAAMTTGQRERVPSAAVLPAPPSAGHDNREIDRRIKELQDRVEANARNQLDQTRNFEDEKNTSSPKRKGKRSAKNQNEDDSSTSSAPSPEADSPRGNAVADTVAAKSGLPANGASGAAAAETGKGGKTEANAAPAAARGVTSGDSNRGGEQHSPITIIAGANFSADNGGSVYLSEEEFSPDRGKFKDGEKVIKKQVCQARPLKNKKSNGSVGIEVFEIYCGDVKKGQWKYKNGKWEPYTTTSQLNHTLSAHE
ncbi:MAG: hypothetical protein WCG27_02160 [Pseudomonadota bacterium]